MISDAFADGTSPVKPPLALSGSLLKILSNSFGFLFEEGQRLGDVEGSLPTLLAAVAIDSVHYEMRLDQLHLVLLPSPEWLVEYLFDLVQLMLPGHLL